MFNLFRRPLNASFIDLVRADQARKSAAAKRIRYYNDRQTADLAAALARRWSRPDDFRLFQLNIVRKVVDSLATVYRKPPVRTFTGWDQAAGEALYRALHANQILKQANRLTRLCKTTALQVQWRDGRPALSVITPDLIDATWTDPASPEELIVTHRPQGVHAENPNAVTYTRWTRTGATLHDYKGNSIPTETAGNPYGALPFVFAFDGYPLDSFFLPGGDDLTEAQESVNVALVNLWRAVEIQAHGQAYASGITATEALATGPDRAIILPEGGTFGFAAPNTPVGSILSAIEYVVKSTAIANNLNPSTFEIDRRGESGVAKLIEDQALIEAREDDIERWRDYEAQLFNLLKLVVNTELPGTIPEDAALSVDFAEPRETLGENQRLEAYSRRLALGIWSPVDALMADNPDVRNRADAARILTERRAETERFAPSDTAEAAQAAFGTPSQGS